MSLSRKWRWLIFALALYICLCAAGGIYLGDAALHPQHRPLSEAEAADFRQAMGALQAGVEDLSITTPDSAVLGAWLVTPKYSNGNVVVLLHGLGDNRLGMTGYGQFLLAHGFTVLLPDARMHGLSGGSVATYGLLERNDIRQWVAAVRAKVEPHCVYGLGESMGGAQLLQSLESSGPFCAVVAESPFASFREIAYDRMGQPFHLGPWVGRTVLRPLVEIAFLRARYKSRVNMEDVSPELSAAASKVPILLIHGEADSNIPVRHSLLIQSESPRTVLWVVAGADHCGAYTAEPQEFETRVIGWFQAHR